MNPRTNYPNYENPYVQTKIAKPQIRIFRELRSGNTGERIYATTVARGAPMDKASEAILALKPVTFRYKKALDPDGTPQFGLVAEDVEKSTSRSRRARCRGKGLHRALRSGERHVAQRVSESASTNRRARQANRTINGAAERAGATDSKGERQGGAEQTCAANGAEQSVKVECCSGACVKRRN